MVEITASATALNRKDFVSDQEVRWCPGCGDYAILAQMQRIMPELGIPRENIVFISGIGCSSRFPYYMDTYGIHSIHGRAPTLATGLKVTNPDLQVWVITGDGDGLSIGGNHLLHTLRRNVGINIILFNNRIYGLTKGQYSPTSLPGSKTKSSPMGSIEQSFNPISVAIGAEATFVARTAATNTKHMATILQRAAEHTGTSFVEIYQNCNIFNNGAWDHLTEASVREDASLFLEDGKPLVFGKDRDRGIRLNGLYPEVVEIDNGICEADLLKHEEDAGGPELGYLLSRLNHPEFPVPFGVFRCVEHPIYEEQLIAQCKTAAQRDPADLNKLYHDSDTWLVSEDSDWEKPGQMRDVAATDTPSTANFLPNIHVVEDAKTDLQHLMYDRVDSLDLPVPTCVKVDTPLSETVAIMQKHDLGCVLVTEANGKLVGIFAQGDIFSQLAGKDIDLANTLVGSMMTIDPTSLRRSAPIGYVLHLMAHHGFRHIPIVDREGKPVMLATFKAILGFVGRLFG